MSETKSVQVEKQMTLPKYMPWVFFSYNFLDQFKRIISSTFLLFFITEYTGISATAMAAVMTIARVADLICSLFSGAIVQNSNTKFGAYRPWLIGCAVAVWTGVAMCFSNPPGFSITAKLVLVAVGYMADGFAMNFITVAQNSLMAKVAGPNPTNRLALSSKRAQGTNASRVVTSALTLPLVTLFLNMGANGYFIVSMIYGVVGLVAAIMLFVVTKEYDKYSPEIKTDSGFSASMSKLFKMYGSAFRNPMIWVLFLADSLNRFGQQSMQGGQVYYFRYSANNLMYQTLAGTVSSFVAMGAAMLVVPLARKLGKKKSSLLANGGAAISYVIIAFTCDKNPMLYIVLSSFVLTFQAILLSFGVNLWLDVAEIQLHETGDDNRPFIMSLWNIPIKIGFIAQAPALAFMLNGSNYQVIDTVGSIPDTSIFVRYFGLIPALLYACAALVMLFLYKVSETRAAECAALNAQAAAEKKAAAAAST